VTQYDYIVARARFLLRTRMFTVGAEVAELFTCSWGRTRLATVVAEITDNHESQLGKR
jgi:hypothetical protein